MYKDLGNGLFQRNRLRDIVKPTLGAGEILLRIKYVGFCGSDLNTYLGRNPMVKMPVIPGHEVGAVIEEIGEGVPVGFEKGMNVTVNPYTNCGKCASCRNGRVNACEHNETLGVQRNGSMQEFLVLPWTKVIPAAGLSDKECALIEPMSVGFHAVSRAQVTDIDTVAVIGCGMIGLGAIVRASLRGARVIALDIDDEKLELAKRLGASMVINSKTENVVERVRELTDGYMADVVIEAVGSPITYVTAIDIVGFTGRVACIGYAKSEVAFQTKYFVQKELDIRTCHAVLAAKDLIDGPFAVINADDYYGPEAFKVIYEYLSTHQDGAVYDYCMVSYLLKNTVSENGTVSRGVCVVNPDGTLHSVTERTGIETYEGGIRCTALVGEGTDDLPVEAPVSMNLWGFGKSFLDEADRRFAGWLRENLPKNPLKCEYFLPTVASELIDEGKAAVTVLKSTDKWYGVTYREDKPTVVAAIAQKTQEGLYPEDLWA